MMRLAAVVVLAMLMVSCRSGRWSWVDDEVPVAAPIVAKCRGGTVNTERRVTDVSVLGRTRSTTYRTDACLD
jgi:hypothetical protein